MRKIKLKIIPLGEVSTDILESIQKGLKLTLRIVSTIGTPIQIPKSAYNHYRDQYKSDIILEFIEKKYSGRILCVTNEDIYADGLNFIFGQARVNGRVALVSIKRLDPRFYRLKEDRSLLKKRVVKEAVHEICHTLGLGHCNRKDCVMNFSNTIMDVDRKSKYLCLSCSKLL